jgi:hypothetical protein
MGPLLDDRLDVSARGVDAKGRPAMMLGVAKKGSCGEPSKSFLLAWENDDVKVESELLPIDPRPVKSQPEMDLHIWSDRQLAVKTERTSELAWSLTFFRREGPKRFVCKAEGDAVVCLPEVK